MKNGEMFLQVLLATALVLSLIVPASVVGASGAVRLPDDHAIGYSVADSSAAALPMALNTPEENVTPMVAASYDRTVGLKSDGTVVAVGYDVFGRCDVGGWTDIVQFAAGYGHTVGVKSDGTVVAAGPVSWLAELAKWNLVVTDFERTPPINWPLIGGIIAAVVAVGLGIFFVRRRRAA